jgi:hypothetical protein
LSSATVFFKSDSSDGANTTEPEEAKTSEEEQPVEILKNDTFEDIRNKLIFSGWEVIKEKGGDDPLFFVPKAHLKTGHWARYDYFDEWELRKYLEETYQWTEPVKAEEVQRAEAREEEPAEPKKKRSRKPTSTKEPRTKKPKGEQAKRKQEERTRQSSMEEEEKDPFYQFSTLITFLRGSLGWKYRAAILRDHITWIYERPGTLGERGELYFDEEQEVVDYCKRNKYKETYYGRVDVPASLR